MSYVALATDHFDEVVFFYGEVLGFPAIEKWDRHNGRGRRFDLGGFRLEILDNARERHPLRLCEASDRFHVVVEVDDIEAASKRIALSAPPPQTTSWGAKLFQLRDPDGVRVTFLEWNKSRSKQT
jgi:catechol 2,3-dioxygenase-like lactoylglutathione lyase family enzyme